MREADMKAVEELKVLVAQNLIHNIKKDGLYKNICDAEFKVFSQFGDDGIIQYLIKCISLPITSFIEFGVENYTESNTRFLLINNNWTGLIIDSDKSNIELIKSHEIYWKYELTAVESFIMKENINRIISNHGFSGEIGILSIDIDGNDYWIWESIIAVNPIIVIIEFNSLFGSKRAVTISYDPLFNRTAAHHSNLYWGCSLAALNLLAEKKGYYFIGCNSNGNNAYFVRKDKIGPLTPKTVAEGYVLSKFRESRDINGNLTFISGKDRLKTIQEMFVIDVESNQLIALKTLIDD